MSYDPNAVAKAVYEKLTGDTTLMAMITGVHRDHAPETAKLPYVVFFFVSETAQDTFTSRGWKLFLQLDIYSASQQGGVTGEDKNGQIQKELSRILDHSQLSVTGYDNVYCLYDFSSPDFEWDEAVARVMVQYSLLITGAKS